MRKLLLILFCSISFTTIVAQQKGFSSESTSSVLNKEDNDKPIPAGFGLEKVFIFKNIETATLQYNTLSTNSVTVYFYTNSMADKKEQKDNVQSSIDKIKYTISGLKDGTGVLINDNGEWRSVWVIDYSKHKPQINSITPIESDDKCDALKLLIDKVDEPLEFRGTGGQVGKINRKYEIVYKRQEWDADNFQYVEKEHIEKDLNIGTEIILNKSAIPNIDTQFTIRGDQFGLKFDNAEEKLSEEYRATAVELQTRAVQTSELPEEGSNITLGGSAPVDIEFYGYGTKTVQYYTWFVYDKKDMKNAIARYSDKDFSYTFDRFGEYEVILEVANSESSCINTKNTSVTIYESELKIPNYFSPGNSSGVHNEFKVYYKSLVKYHCVIFNRWGNKVFESRDPEQGWDGRYKGSLVNPGVYFYSIVAKGADGRNYKKGGDINILR